ncbi:MAG: UPF0182 family protein, partial [Acidobacteriota bacterium]
MSNDFFVDSVPPNEEPPRGSSFRFLRSPWLIFILILVFFLLIWPAVVGFYTELLWFREVGYSNVFRTAIESKLWLGGGAFLVGALFIWANLKLALRFSAGRARLV